MAEEIIKKKRTYKKPSLVDFRKAAELTGGNISKMANRFGCCRKVIYEWIKDDAEFASVIEDFRGKLLDECVDTARIVAMGIPEYEDIVDPETGAKKKVFKKWKYPPDSNMLRYIMSTLGRKEGFGESMDITSDGKALPNKVAVEILYNKKEDCALQSQDKGAQSKEESEQKS